MITLNLLPPQEKKNLYYNKLDNLVLICAGEILVAFLILIALFGVTLFTISSQIKIVQKEIDSYEVGIKKEALEELNQKIDKANEKIKRLDLLQENHIRYSGFLEHVSFLIPESAKISNITIIQQAAAQNIPQKTIFNLHGLASSRDDVLKIKNGLESSVFLEEVETPLSNLVKATDIDFSFSATIKEDELKTKIIP